MTLQSTLGEEWEKKFSLVMIHSNLLMFCYL